MSLAATTTTSLRVPRFRRSASGATRETHGLLEALGTAEAAPTEPARAMVETVPRVAQKKTQVVEHPLAQHAVNMLRNKHTPPTQFRTISNQLLVLLTLEAARTLPTRAEQIETAAAPHTGQALAKQVVFLSVTRHGLGLSHAIADFIPGVLVGAISLERVGGESHAVEPRLHLPNAPALGDVRVIIFDPVVASGGTISIALNLLRRSGATDISLISFLVSLPGLSRLHTSFPDLTVWTAAIDSELDPKRGPLPGMGNFGERLYG